MKPSPGVQEAGSVARQTNAEAELQDRKQTANRVEFRASESQTGTVEYNQYTHHSTTQQNSTAQHSTINWIAPCLIAAL